MERIKPTGDGTISWKQTGGGSFRLGSGKIIKPGQTFRARPDQIPLGFRDVVVAQEAIPPGPFQSKETATMVDIPGIEAKYTLAPRGKSKLWYDILDAKGKVLNEKGLPKEAAEKLIKDLEQ